MKNLNVTDLDDLKSERNVNDNNIGTFMATIEEGKALKREVIATFKDDDGYLVADKCFAEKDLILLNLADGKKLKYGKLDIK